MSIPHSLPYLGLMICLPSAIRLDALFRIGVLTSGAPWSCSLASSPLVSVVVFGLSKPILAIMSLYMLPLLLVLGRGCVSHTMSSGLLACVVSVFGYELPMRSMLLLGWVSSHLLNLWDLLIFRWLDGSTSHVCFFQMLASM